MKISPPSAFLFGCLGIIGMGSCTKSSSTPKPATKVIPTNPKVAAAICDYAFSDTTLTNNGWTEVFNDNFSTGLSNWYAYTGGVTKDLECNEPANAQIVNGELQISALKQTVTGSTTVGSTTQNTFNYTSASIVTNQTFSANSTTPKVMVVARVQVASGYGITSVFDSYGQNWPTNGEINFFQVEGDDTKEYATNYFYGTALNQNLVTDGMLYDPTNADLSACYHVYMTEWTQNALYYYLDGSLVETKTSGGYVPSLFGKEESIGLSLPVGGLFYNNLVDANIQVGTMHVTYVKVFTSN